MIVSLLSCLGSEFEFQMSTLIGRTQVSMGP